MENSKRKGIISILIIAICLCLCIGATYAYFTDSATSKGNKIQAGKLKVDFELLNKDTLIWNSIKESQDPIFYHEKWEPGYTDVKLLKVDNEETLAIKWEAKFLYEGQLPALANAIEVYVKTSDSEFAYPTSRDDFDSSWEYEGTLTEFANNISTILNGELLSGESDYFGIALYMPTTVEDNTLQGQSIDPFDIQILATQLSYESDAFDEKYDDITIDPNGGVTPPEDTEETTSSTSTEEPTETEPTEPEPTETEPGGNDEPVEPVEPTDPELFTWALNDDGASYTVTGLVNPGTVADLVIPATYRGLPVTRVGSHAFNNDYTITSVTIPDSVTTIGDSAFYDCSSLLTVLIPDGITYIGKYAFSECDNLQYNEDNNAYYLGNDSNPYVVLMRVKDITIMSCDVNDNTKIICYSAFFDCSNLTSVDISDSVVQIGDYAFYNCSNLTSVDIPDSVVQIGDDAFTYCSDLTNVTIGNSVTTIGNSAFYYCYGLTSIEIPDSVTTIGDYAFYTCLGLTSIVIPDGVTTIGNYAFVHSGLVSVTIGDGVTIIGEGAFSSTALTSIYIPKSITTIGENPFSFCYSLTNIVVDEENAAYQSIDGNLYSKDGTLLIAYAAGKSDTSFAIPNGVTIIGDDAFTYCSNLTSVTIPDSVTTIDFSAFEGCSGLTELTIPNSVITIFDYAFYGCSNLKNIRFEGNIEQWDAVNCYYRWNDGIPAIEVVCSDGTVELPYWD